MEKYKNTNKIITSIILLLSIVITLLGCNNKRLQYEIPNYENNEVVFELKDVVFEEKGNAWESYIEGKGICVNKKSKQYEFVIIKFAFFNERGEHLGDSTPEIYKNVKPNETFKIRIETYGINFADINIDNTQVYFDYG